MELEVDPPRFRAQVVAFELTSPLVILSAGAPSCLWPEALSLRPGLSPGGALSAPDHPWTDGWPWRLPPMVSPGPDRPQRDLTLTNASVLAWWPFNHPLTRRHV